MQPNLKTAFETTMLDRIINTVPDMPDHVFSKRFESKMERLIKEKVSVKINRVTKRQFLTYIMIAVFVAVVTACSIEPLREFFKRFFTEIFDTHTVVQSEDYSNAPETIIDVYEITYIPNGFELTYKDEIYDFTAYIFSEYRNNDNFVTFTQSVKSKYKINVNTENYSMQYISINDKEGYLIELDNNECCISWDNGDYIFTLCGNIDKNALIYIAESVQKVE